MDGLGLLGFLIVGLIAGYIAEKATGSNHGLLTNLVVGVIGAILGGFLFRLVGLAATGLLGSLICATVGAIVLLFLLQKFGRRVRDRGWKGGATTEQFGTAVARV